MFKKIVPVAVVALTALAAAGTASADNAIFPRDATANKLAALDAQSSQQASQQPLTSLQSASSAQGQSDSKALVRSDAQSLNGASPFNPTASTSVQVLDPSAIHDGWWKGR